MRLNGKIELIAIAGCLLFAVAISLYHLSYPGFLGLSCKAWNLVWAIAENGFSLLLCTITAWLTTGSMRFMFTWIAAAYFPIKILYHISCYSGVYLFSKEGWECIWSIEVVLLLLIGLICCAIYIKNDYEVSESVQ
jgi:hypothetical protein